MALAELVLPKYSLRRAEWHHNSIATLLLDLPIVSILEFDPVQDLTIIVMALNQIFSTRKPSKLRVNQSSTIAQAAASLLIPASFTTPSMSHPDAQSTASSAVTWYEFF